MLRPNSKPKISCTWIDLIARLPTVAMASMQPRLILYIPDCFVALRLFLQYNKTIPPREIY